MPCKALQEELEAATKDEEEQDGSDGGGEDNGGSDSDASSGFGLGGAEAPQKRLRHKTPTPASSTDKGKEKPDKSKAASSDKTTSDRQKAQACVQLAETALKNLKQVDAAALWKNTLKESEVRGRVAKATQAKADLEQLEPTLDPSKAANALEKVTKVIGSLNELLTWVPAFQDVVGKLRGKKLIDDLATSIFQDELMGACKNSMMDADTLSALLLFIGQKTYEARHIVIIIDLPHAVCKCITTITIPHHHNDFALFHRHASSSSKLFTINY